MTNLTLNNTKSATFVEEETIDNTKALCQNQINKIMEDPFIKAMMNAKTPEDILSIPRKPPKKHKYQLTAYINNDLLEHILTSENLSSLERIYMFYINVASNFAFRNNSTEIIKARAHHAKEISVTTRTITNLQSRMKTKGYIKLRCKWNEEKNKYDYCRITPTLPHQIGRKLLHQVYCKRKLPKGDFNDIATDKYTRVLNNIGIKYTVDLYLYHLILKSNLLSATEKVIWFYVHYLTYIAKKPTNEFTTIISSKRIAKALHMHIDTIKKSMAVLERLGLLTREFTKQKTWQVFPVESVGEIDSTSRICKENHVKTTNHVSIFYPMLEELSKFTEKETGVKYSEKNLEKILFKISQETEFHRYKNFKEYANHMVKLIKEYNKPYTPKIVDLKKRTNLEKHFTHLAENLSQNSYNKLNISEEHVSSVLPILNQEQLQAATKILNSNDLSMIEGLPGSGKTLTLSAITKIYTKAGYNIIGTATSSTASQCLTSATQINAKNVSLLRKQWLEGQNVQFRLNLPLDYYEHPEYQNLPKLLPENTILVVDEASLIDLQTMDFLVNEAIKSKSKIIAVGDLNQLGAVGLKGAFKKISYIANSAKLCNIQRHNASEHAKEYKESSIALSNKDIAKSLSILEKINAIKCYSNDPNTILEMARSFTEQYIKYQSDPVMHKQIRIGAYTRTSVKRINKLVHELLVENQILQNEKIFKSSNGNIPLCIGEQIIFTKNNYTLNILNGEIGSIISIANNSFDVKIKDAFGNYKNITITPSYKNFYYAYASTAHCLQGETIDNMYVFFEQEILYETFNVLLTRHRKSVQIYCSSQTTDSVIYSSTGCSYSQRSHTEIITSSNIGLQRHHIGMILRASRRSNDNFSTDTNDVPLIKNYLNSKANLISTIKTCSEQNLIFNYSTQLKNNACLILDNLKDDIKIGHLKLSDELLQNNISIEFLKKHAKLSNYHYTKNNLIENSCLEIKSFKKLLGKLSNFLLRKKPVNYSKKLSIFLYDLKVLNNAINCFELLQKKLFKILSEQKNIGLLNTDHIQNHMQVISKQLMFLKLFTPNNQELNLINTLQTNLPKLSNFKTLIYKYSRYSKIEKITINTKTFKQLSQCDIRYLSSKYGPVLNSDGKFRECTNWLNYGSLTINKQSGYWTRYSSDDKGTIYDLVSKALGINFKAALKQIQLDLNTKPDTYQVENLVMSTKQNSKVSVYQKNKITYIYKDEKDDIIGYVLRTDTKTGKTIRPIKINEDGSKSFGGFTHNNHKPIYGLEKLKNNNPILIVEGEKTADIAQKLFPSLSVISWLGGSASVKQVNWSLLRKKIHYLTKIIIWPDNDVPGIKAAQYINKEVYNSSIIDVSQYGDKWDLADAVKDQYQDIIKKIGTELNANQREINERDLYPRYKRYIEDLINLARNRCPRGRKYEDRLNFEINVISKLGFEQDFLTIFELTEYLRFHNIKFNLRGSANASLFAQLILLHDTDPIANKLNFDRFLSLNSEHCPDFDIEIQASKKHKAEEFMFVHHSNAARLYVKNKNNLLQKHPTAIALLDEKYPTEYVLENNILQKHLKIDYKKVKAKKIDILSSQILDKIAKLEAKHGNKYINPQKAYELISKGDTKDIFQLSSKLAKKIASNMDIKNKNDLITLLALPRPGAIDNAKYFYKNNTLKKPFSDPKNIFVETNGICIFQEQLMQAASEYYNIQDTNKFRKEFSNYTKQELINLAIQNGLSKKDANELYNQLNFASQYSYNKAHAVNYAEITFKTAYFKAHYIDDFNELEGKEDEE